LALKFVIIWIIICFFPLALFAQQKKLVYEQQIWPGYNATIKFNQRWGIWLDGELHRMTIFLIISLSLRYDLQALII
jgi:hypothetical protein